MNKTEILAPVGAREQLTAAVACGADAVYFGSSVLNARRSAANFAGEALEEAVEYCHTRGVKVYLTLNTVTLEKEIPAALELVQTACALGIDAIIVQDMGLVRLIRQAAPTMRLHASTQMAVHNLAGAQALEQLGFARVVLAREMSRAEIAEVAQNTTLETEVFVHGALCMCVSGQCYMSSIIGERSGNRGLCAQPCRLPFYVQDPNLYDLSLKDLSLVEQIDALREAGVTSLKIEGRMKRPEYVAAAVTACKEALAGEPPHLDNLRAVFSRSGFTQGYFNAKLGNEMFGVRMKQDVVAADRAVLGELAQLYHREAPRVALCATVVLQEACPVTLSITDENGNHAAVTGECPQLAINKPTTAEMIEQSLRKLGGTPYYLSEVEITCGEGLMLPVSQLNVLRRDAVEQITAQRATPKPVPFTIPKPIPTSPACGEQNPAPAPHNGGMSAGTARARFAKREQIPMAAIDGLEQIILPVEEAAKINDPAILSRLVGELPRIDFTNYRSVQPAVDALKEKGVTRLLAGNLGGVQYAQQQGFSVAGDFALNITNHASAEQYAALGCTDITASFELNLNEVTRLGQTPPCGIIAYGYLPLMITRNCPARLERNCSTCTGISMMYDRLGNGFFVSCGGGRKIIEIFNHLPLYLADRLPELQNLAFITLYFTVETQQQCARVLYEYQNGGGKHENITRGLYYRNIM